MRLQSVVESGEFDVVVLDAPPTGDLMKFLRLPDVLQWVMERYRPWERGVLQRARPLADALGWPLPPEPVVDEMEGWYTRVRRVSAMLTDHSRVSVRLVMTPDRVALAETRRALTWTCLLGMNVDGVILNRVLPDGESSGLYAAWMERQAAVLVEAETAFGDLPLLRAELRAEEVVGLPHLEAFAAALFHERDPAGVWSEVPPVRWSENGPEAELRLRLPFLKRGQFRLLAGEEGLTLMLGNQRRIVPLPASVQRRAMLGARYEAGWLIVRYGPQAAGEPQR
jgi:arsenite-transporting ATPase